jgi:ribosomal protein S14
MNKKMIASRRREPCEQCGQTKGVSWEQHWRAYLCRDCAQELADQERWETESWVDATSRGW